MKTKFMFAALVVFSAQAFAGTPVWKSVYTDLTKDCVEVSSANQNAEIDFYDAECKAFGGYQLNIEGGDLRYGPALRYNGVMLDVGSTGAFHDTGSTKVEWVYTLSKEVDGAGTLEWKGFIYRLSQATENGSGPDESVLYSVRLNKEQTCLVGTSTTNQAARDLIYNNAPCL